MEWLVAMDKQSVKLNASVLDIQERLNKRKAEGNYDDEYWKFQNDLKSECYKIFITPKMVDSISKEALVVLMGLQSQLQFVAHHRFLLKFSKH